MFPALDGAKPVAAYAGLRPAGRGVNYLIGISSACPRLVNVAAIRSTGLTAAPAIAERVCRLVSEAGLSLGAEQPLAAAPEGPEPGAFDGPWWRRTAAFRGTLA
jgi:glycerol-3-phosphate dehydrogenase